MVGQPEADDLNQEVWLIVYRRIKTLVNAEGFRTWLFQVTRNQTLDFFRRSKRVAEFKEVLSNEVINEFFSDELEVDTQQVLNGLETLSKKHREVLTLNFLEGMDYSEIALITGCSVGTVKSRIFHAKKQLKEDYKPKK